MLAALLPLSACAVGPDYRPPELKPAAAFRNVSGDVAPTPEWWRAFRDPVLDALEEKALAQNLDVAQSMARVEQSRAAAGAARAARLPVVESDPQAAAARQSRLGQNRATYALFPTYPRYVSLYDLTAGASWELDLFGGLKRQSQASKAELEAAEANLAGMRVSVAGDVADAYVRLRADQQRLMLAERLTKGAIELVDLVSRNWRAGQAPRSDVDQAQSLLAQALAAQAPLRADIEAQLNRLAVLTGQSPEAERAGLEAPRPLPAAPDFAAGSPVELIRRRPDLIAAERRLAAADARIGAAISDYYPKINLQGLVGWESTATGRLFQPGAQEAQGLLGVRWRLFDFGRIDAEVAQAKGVRAEALAAYRSAVLRAAEDVEDALIERRAQAEAAAALHRAEAALQRAFDSARGAYASGTASRIEVIEADRQLVQIQDQAIAADADAARAAIALVRALGG
jgi:NodT family efflux transporter outer membrane factor (OMF) lipoprotein